jgi:hypothetical protein
MKGFGVLLETHGVERTKQIMEVAKNLDKNPQTVNLMTGTAQRFNPSTNRFEPIYTPTYKTKKDKNGVLRYVYDSKGRKIELKQTMADQKKISLLELKAHPEKYGLEASDFNVQVNMEPEYDTTTGKEIKPGLGAEAEAKVFTGTEKQGKHMPNYYVPNSLQPHYTRVGKDKAVGYYTYDLNINDHIFRMTKPMDEFELVTGTNIK